MASIYDWSLLSANNANADSDINWAEGQAPSTVNNSARVMMQRIKELIADLGATTAVGGSANVLTFAAESAFTSYVDGIRVAFRASTDNTGAVTLNVNAVGAKPVVRFSLDGETALTGGEIQGGGIYEVIYSAALNGATGGWLILNPTQLQQITPGLISMHGSDVVPAGWLECDGAAVSRTTYANLFAVIATKWGAGNGTTTFNLPDFRGEFVRGWDHGRGIDTGRAFASAQADEFKSHVHAQRGAGLSGSNTTAQYSTNLTTTGVQLTNTDSTGGTETRPRNIAVMWVIKT